VIFTEETGKGVRFMVGFSRRDFLRTPFLPPPPYFPTISVYTLLIVEVGKKTQGRVRIFFFSGAGSIIFCFEACVKIPTSISSVFFTHSDFLINVSE
jgi:hypothetical protein